MTKDSDRGDYYFYEFLYCCRSQRWPLFIFISVSFRLKISHWLRVNVCLITCVDGKGNGSLSPQERYGYWEKSFLYWLHTKSVTKGCLSSMDWALSISFTDNKSLTKWWQLINITWFEVLVNIDFFSAHTKRIRIKLEKTAIKNRIRDMEYHFDKWRDI